MTHTIPQLLDRVNVKMTARLNFSKRRREEWAGDPKANHYTVTLSCGGATMGLCYSMGSGIKGEPELADVLDCLASDAVGFENSRNFADWCAEYGYDTDSRKAERIYKTIGRQAASLKRLLGESEYAALLWNTERL